MDSQLIHRRPPEASIASSGELTSYIRARAAERPLVIVLDEMQWADTTSWDALEHLLSQLDADRIMICLTQRPDSTLDTAEHQQMLKRHEFARELTLSRLDARRSEAVARSGASIDSRLAANSSRFSTGTRKGTRCSSRSCSARWSRTGRSGTAEAAGSGRRSPSCDSPGARGVDRAAIEQILIEHAGGAWHRGDRRTSIRRSACSSARAPGASRRSVSAISEAMLAGLLRPTDERRQGGFAFAHDEIAEVLVESIPRERVRQLHQRVAQSLATQHPERAGEIAFHFDAAGESADAYRWAQIAAKAADRVTRTGRPELYPQMAARNATTPAELAEIRVSLAHVAETGGRYDEVEELCDLAIEWFEGQSDERRALSLRRMSERARMEQGQPARVTLDALIALDADAKRLGFDRERVAILTMASQTHGRLGEMRLAERLAAEGVEMAERIGDNTRVGGRVESARRNLGGGGARASIRRVRACSGVVRVTR